MCKKKKEKKKKGERQGKTKRNGQRVLNAFNLNDLIFRSHPFASRLFRTLQGKYATAALKSPNAQISKLLFTSYL